MRERRESFISWPEYSPLAHSQLLFLDQDRRGRLPFASHHVEGVFNGELFSVQRTSVFLMEEGLPFSTYLPCLDQGFFFPLQSPIQIKPSLPESESGREAVISPSSLVAKSAR